MEPDPINMRIKLILIVIVLLLSLNLQIQAEEELPEIIGEHYRHGLQYFKKDQYPQAIQKFQAVLNQHPHFFRLTIIWQRFIKPKSYQPKPSLIIKK